MSKHIELGKRGEQIAIQFLKRKGYQIIVQNWRCPFGELDIIAKHHNILVFVEVKTRSGASFGFPEESVNTTKQRRLRKLAEYYLMKERISPNCQLRFDCIAMILDDSARPRYFRHIKNIFF